VLREIIGTEYAERTKQALVSVQVLILPTGGSVINSLCVVSCGNFHKKYLLKEPETFILYYLSTGLYEWMMNTKSGGP
jgi:hypothetical protein